jgi:hypothetical protein
MLEEGAVYTAFAVGLVGDNPPLQAALGTDLPPRPGDSAPNNRVDIEDLFLLLAQWGHCPPVCITGQNDDGMVDVDDLFTMLNNWGPCPK